MYQKLIKFIIGSGFYPKSITKGNKMIELVQDINNLFTFFIFLTKMKKNKSSILCVGDYNVFNKFSYSFKIKQEGIFIIHKWVNGLLTNWKDVSSVLTKLKQTTPKVTQSKKLKLLKVFKLKNITKRPDLIIVVNNKINPVLINECFLCNVPVIVIIFSSDSRMVSIKIGSYNLSLNLTSISSKWFITQLIGSNIIRLITL